MPGDPAGLLRRALHRALQLLSPGQPAGAGRYNDYYDDVPGFSAASTKWLWQHGAIGVGADTFGPDATMDQDFGSTTEITGLGGITLENMGPGLAHMRACGDWIELNGPRLTSTSHDQLGGSLDFSGAWMGMDGWTVRHCTQTEDGSSAWGTHHSTSPVTARTKFPGVSSGNLSNASLPSVALLLGRVAPVPDLS